MSTKYLKNKDTGVVFAANAILEKLPYLVPCDVDGNLVDSDAIESSSAINIPVETEKEHTDEDILKVISTLAAADWTKARFGRPACPKAAAIKAALGYAVAADRIEGLVAEYGLTPPQAEEE